MLLEGAHATGDLAAGIGILVVLLGLDVLLVLAIAARLRRHPGDEEVDADDA